MSRSQKWPLETFHHVHIIVPHMEETASFLETIGLPLRRYTHQLAGEFDVLEGITREEFRELGYRVATLGEVHLQFMSPGRMQSPHRKFIEASGGPRLFSAGFVVADIDEAEEELVRRGLQPMIRGRHQSGWGFTYFDTMMKLGLNICVRQSPRGEPSTDILKDVDTVWCPFQHVCCYVDDLEDATAFLAAVGLATTGYPHHSQGDFRLLEGMTKDAFWKLGYQHALIGDVHFQIMSPAAEETPQKLFVDRYGRRAYSIGFYVDDVGTAESSLLNRGLNVLWKGRHENGWGFTYSDTVNRIGINLCIRQSPST
jgi:methylmalonyl-CoA/ethylmalonyl-CoA epimerase